MRRYPNPPMRTASIVLAIALACTPFTFAFAHGGGHGKGKGGHHDDHGGGGGGGGPTATLSGAGQRLTFSFGGNIQLRDGKAKGEFALVAHPIAPQGTTLNVACHYRVFSDVTIVGHTATFTGKGKCQRILTSGELEHFNATNVFQIVDNPGGDAIDVNFVGGSGIAVPAGALEFGDFTVTPAP